MIERTFCRICQAYCGLVVTTGNGAVTSVRADRDHPVSRGYSCVKGRSLGELHADPRRLLAHRLRGEEASADVVLDDLAARLRAVVDTHGPDAVGFYRGTASYFDSAGLVTLGALIAGLGSRSLFTTSSIDQIARFWVSEQMCGMFNALPLIDFAGTRLTVMVGTNPPVAHGHVNSWPDPVTRLRALARQGELWCLDVRRSETAALSTRHVQPRPGTDWAVLGHVVREVLADGADQTFLADHAADVDALRVAVAPLDRQRAASIAGVPAADLDDLVAAVRRHGRLAVQTGTGATMGAFGDVTEWMAWALMAVTGSLDRPGGVWFSSGFLRPRHTPGSPPTEPGPASRPGLLGRFGERPTASLVDEIEAGNVRALLVTGGNPLRAVPGTARIAAAFERLDVLAVADLLPTATVQVATHVLACAGQFERADVALVETMYPVPASQYTPALLDPPGATRPLFELYSGLMTRLGLQPPAPDSETLFTGLAGERAEALRAERLLVGEPEFGWFTEQIVPGGRWALAPAPLQARLAEAFIPAPEAAADALVLTPRRQLGHMNTLMAGDHDRPDLLMHPDDAAARGIASGATVEVRAAGGAVRAEVLVDAGIRRGVVSLPHGYDAPNISDLTTDTTSVHPAYGMPTLSGVPVTVTATDA